MITDFAIHVLSFTQKFSRQIFLSIFSDPPYKLQQFLGSEVKMVIIFLLMNTSGVNASHIVNQTRTLMGGRKYQKKRCGCCMITVNMFIIQVISRHCSKCA